MEFGKKHYILFIFIVVISPIVISQVLRIPTLDLTIGTEESWVSFFFNASQEINSNVVSVSGICLAVGQSHKFELTMDIPLIEGILEVSCKIEYYDLLRNKYEQEIKLGPRVDKELPNKNLQIVDVTSPIHISNKHA